MVNIRDSDSISVKKVSDKVYELSSVYGGCFRHKQYIGYNRKSAVALFKSELLGTPAIEKPHVEKPKTTKRATSTSFLEALKRDIASK